MEIDYERWNFRKQQNSFRSYGSWGQFSKDEYLTHGDVRVDLFKRLVLDCYDVMHTQSLKHVSEDLVEALSNWEKQHKFNR